MEKEFVCINCGENYKSNKKNSKYCSMKCRREYNRIHYKCDCCGKDIIIQRSRYNRLLNNKLRNIFCSRECNTKFQTKLVTKVCENCHNEYKICKAFENTQRFCSRSCYEEYRTKMSVTHIRKICPVCGKEYISSYAEQMFCSVECRGKNDRSPYTKLGEYLRANNRHWRENILKTKGVKCELTGKTDNIVLHHIRSFNLILQETLSLLCLPLYESPYDYTDKELKEIRDLFKNVQNKYGYAIISDDIHKLFHSEYGYGNNTENQWNEFIDKYKFRDKYIA